MIKCSRIPIQAHVTTIVSFQLFFILTSIKLRLFLCNQCINDTYHISIVSTWGKNRVRIILIKKYCRLHSNDVPRASDQQSLPHVTRFPSSFFTKAQEKRFLQDPFSRGIARRCWLSICLAIPVVNNSDPHATRRRGTVCSVYHRSDERLVEWPVKGLSSVIGKQNAGYPSDALFGHSWSPDWQQPHRRESRYGVDHEWHGGRSSPPGRRRADKSLVATESRGA